jgi:hypothetical protein
MSEKTSKKNMSEIKSIPAAIESENKVASKTFDFLEEIKKHIKPYPYSWNEMIVWVTTYPSLDPYRKVDRTMMPEKRPCLGSITVNLQNPAGKMGYLGYADFWDIEESRHNPELWGYDFQGTPICDKNVKGHKDFDIKQNYRLELTFDDESVSIDFRGRRPDEKTKPKMDRVE